MKYSAVNLYHLYTAAKVSIKDYRKYEKILSSREKTTNLGEREKESLYELVLCLIQHKCNVNKLDDFYYSYSIPHIGKEFDLLKIDDNKILNIELKSENVGLDRIKAQLVRNNNYLKYLSKKIYLFTFVSDEKTFYKLDEDFNLALSSCEEVLDVINEFNGSYICDINELFKPSFYLVSPNSTPEKFINEEYFLTSQQEFIKNKILNTNDKNLFKISGEAGTGKTLLLFDLARYYSKENKVLIINCNKINPAHKLINNSIKNLIVLAQEEVLYDINIIHSSNYIFIDEAQRIDNNLWNILLENLDKKVFFFLDPKQVLTKEEIKANYSNQIDKLGAYKYTLSNRIRINNSISTFTNQLFDFSKKHSNLDLSCVSICYASNLNELYTYFKMYKKEYTYISATNDFNNTNINRIDILDAIGKDYENVLMVLDNNYFYKDNKLSSNNYRDNNYLYLKILYQGLTRTREKVVLLIYKNKKLFKDIIENL